MVCHPSQHKTLKVYPVETIQQLTKLRSEGRVEEDSRVVCCMPFDSFNKASVKTKVGDGMQ